MLGSQTTQTEAEISAVCVYWRGNFAADMSAVKSNNNEDYMHVNTWYFGQEAFTACQTYTEGCCYTTIGLVKKRENETDEPRIC